MTDKTKNKAQKSPRTDRSLLPKTRIGLLRYQVRCYDDAAAQIRARLPAMDDHTKLRAYQTLWNIEHQRRELQDKLITKRVKHV